MAKGPPNLEPAAADLIRMNFRGTICEATTQQADFGKNCLFQVATWRDDGNNCARFGISARWHGNGSPERMDMHTVTSFVIELMTIGYEALSPVEFFDILRRCKVSMIVDVRELPISRRVGFAKSALAAGLAKHGINYTHMPALGCPRGIRHGYRQDGDWARYTRAFKQYLETQLTALEELSGLMKAHRCCLLCFEADYNFCHRSFVAERVVSAAQTTVRVYHLTGPVEGRVVRHELAAA